MGNWGFGLLDGDDEQDILSAYHEAIVVDKLTPAEAGSKVRARHNWDQSGELQALVTVCLATIQMIRGELTAGMQDLALEAIDAAHPGDRLLWHDSDPRRASMLACLRDVLAAYDPENPFDVSSAPDFLFNEDLWGQVAGWEDQDIALAGIGDEILSEKDLGTFEPDRE